MALFIKTSLKTFGPYRGRKRSQALAAVRGLAGSEAYKVLQRLETSGKLPESFSSQVERMGPKADNPKAEKGNWPPYNVDALVSNIGRVFRNRDIGKLSGTAYRFITLHMGFIAHYSLEGFKGSYRDIGLFARRLQTSEHSDDYGYNLGWAEQQLNRPDRLGDYGPNYTRSIADTIKGIVAIARRYYPGRGTMRMLNPVELLSPPEILDAIYELPKGEKKFKKFVQKTLGGKLNFVPSTGQYKWSHNPRTLSGAPYGYIKKRPGRAARPEV